jgi:HTH-type transcriptional regulator/antitoxin HigA
MAVKASDRTVPDTYLKLVKRFPLTRIRDDAHLAEAHGIIDRLLQRDLDQGEEDYLDVLTDVVGAYEDEHYPIPDASEADVLRELMRSNGFSQPRLAKLTGIAQSTISAVLNNVRSLTKDQVGTLAKVFGLSPAVFFPVAVRRG